MKRFMYVLLLGLFILSACSSENNADAEQSSASGDTAETTAPVSEELEAPIEEPVPAGFSSFQNETAYIMGKDTLETVNDDYEEYPNTSLVFAVQDDDGTTYYIKERNDYIDNNGILYEFYTVSEDGSISLTNAITSPALSKYAADSDISYSDISTDQKIIDGYLITKIERETGEQEGSKAVKEITVEMSDIADALAQQNTQSKTAHEQDITYHTEIDEESDYVDDFGDIVPTSEGAAYLYADTIESFTGLLLTGEKAGKAIHLNDTYDLAYEADEVLYVDLENGYYFPTEVSETIVRKVDNESGEPMYDGAEDKTIYVPNDAQAVYPGDENAFFVLGDDENGNSVVSVVSHDLNLVDSLSYTPEGEEESYSIYYLGNDTFMALEDYEYQRKNTMKISFSTYATGNE